MAYGLAIVSRPEATATTTGFGPAWNNPFRIALRERVAADAVYAPLDLPACDLIVEFVY
jgi:hypothetical protein